MISQEISQEKKKPPVSSRRQNVASFSQNDSGNKIKDDIHILTYNIKCVKSNDNMFNQIRQGSTTNILTKMRAIEGKNAKVDSITGTATIKKGEFILAIPEYGNTHGLKLKTSTHQLLDILTIKLTETGAKSPTVTMTLDEYMEKRGLKDRKEAKKHVINDMIILRQAKIEGVEKRGKKIEKYSFINIADSGEVKRNGDIIFTFGNTFYNMLLSYNIMPYPTQLQTINSGRNPNSYYLLRKIAEHKNMNVGKKNEDIISIKTLLDVAPFIPSYDEVMETDRACNKRIIEPFERDMGALQKTLTWHYCKSGGEPLTEAEKENLDYHTFIELMVHTNWTSYPDQTERIEKKAAQIAAKKTKKEEK